MRRLRLLCLCVVVETVSVAGAMPLCAPSPETRPLNRLSTTSAKSAATTVSGHLHAVVLFGLFAGEDAGSGLPSWAAAIFDAERPGSLTDYYTTMSEGQFQLTGQVLPRYYRSKDGPREYLQQNTAYGAFDRFVVEVLDDADPEIDFGLFDNDGPDGRANSGDDDGYVDFLFVNTRSAPTGFIRDSATGIAILGIRRDYVTGDISANGGLIRIRRDDHPAGIGGIVQRGASFAEAVGTMAHEFGHALGLPDLFDLSFQFDEDRGADDSAGIGYWGIMGHGNRGWQERGRPTPFSAWSLQQLGWIGSGNSRLVVVDGHLDDVLLQDPRAGGTVYLLPSRENEVYYLIEYRSPTSSYYDALLPKAGVLIWQVDQSRSGNHDERRKLVDLVCADGLYADRAFPAGREPDPFHGSDNLDFWAHSKTYRQTYQGNLGDETDLFDGVRYREFSPVSNPASPFGVSVTDLRRQGDGMLATLDTRNQRWAGTIRDEVTWQDTVYLDGDITVAVGAELTIAPGTLILAGPDRLPTGIDALRTELIVEGTLRGGLDSAEPVVFTAPGSSPQPGAWFGIRAQARSDVRLENAVIQFARTAVTVDRQARSVALATVQILDSAGDGLVVGEEGTTGLRGSLEAHEIQVRRSGGVGLRAFAGPTIEVLASTFADNRGGGIARADGFVQVKDSDFTGQDEHVRLSDTFGSITGSSFAGGAVGVRIVDSESFQLTGNDFSETTTAILSSNAAPSIESNSFHQVGTAIIASGSSVPARLLLNVVDGAQHLLRNETGLSLVAEHNWWGTSNEGDIVDRMEGTVDWEPLLMTDPRLPLDFGLQSRYPNPFNSGVTIEFAVGVDQVVANFDGRMRLDIYSINGQRVCTLVDRPAAAGTFQATWNGRGDDGAALSTGVYLYRLVVGRRSDSGRMMLLR